MALSNYLKPGVSDRSRVRIMTVDPSVRRVEGMLKDGSMIQIAVWDVPNAFRWPVEGEIWIISRQNGIPMLDHRVQDGQVTNPGPDVQVEPEPAPIDAMSPGDMKLDASTVINANGLTFVAVDLTGIENGWTLKWDSTLNRFVASP